MSTNETAERRDPEGTLDAMREIKGMSGEMARLVLATLVCTEGVELSQFNRAIEISKANVANAE